MLIESLLQLPRWWLKPIVSIRNHPMWHVKQVFADTIKLLFLTDWQNWLGLDATLLGVVDYSIKHAER